MSEQASDTLRSSPGEGRQTMSIHTRKITDSCRDKDCIEDLRVYLTTGSQAILDTAANARVRCAELLTTYIDVEPVAFEGHHYCIDVTFYYRILADAVVGSCRPATLYGLAVFTKRAVLCGEDSRAHIYRSDTRINEPDGCTHSYSNRPTAVVEVLDPMVLSSKVKDPCGSTDTDAVTVGSFIAEGCEVYGSVRHSVISLGCTIGEGAVVEDSVIMPGVTIEPGAIVRHAILGEDSRVCRNAVVGGAFGPGEKKQISVTAKGAVVEANSVLLPGEML